MAITDWPLEERPREKLLQKGALALSDAELLAIFLRTGTRGKTAVDLARDLLNRFGGLRPLLEAGHKEYTQLQATTEMARRHLLEKLRRDDVMENPDHTRRYLQSRLRDYPHEVFACLFLDNRHRVIAFEELFQGTINGASVYPREVVKKALSHNAASVILAHNHPSGVAEPSESDRNITQQLSKALALVDIRVLDHLVVGDGETVSMAERGLM
jgi:DNA repair protein RadC